MSEPEKIPEVKHLELEIFQSGNVVGCVPGKLKQVCETKGSTELHLFGSVECKTNTVYSGPETC